MLDEQYMRFALRLAEGMQGQTVPNPSVGAVIVKDGSIIGFGAHLQAGKEHAEVVALHMAGDNANGATLYVTLEPCCHTGKTSPCTTAIIQSKIKRVVIACKDKHKVVAGKGIRALEKAGIIVTAGCLEKEAASLYKAFFQRVQTGIPYVTLKTAMSLDGKIATSSGESKWITNILSREDAHYYRHQHDAILVGVQTVLADNPRLTTRIQGGKNPIRIILDHHLRTPTNAYVVTDNQADTWIFVGGDVPEERKREFSIYPLVRIVTVEEEKIEVANVLAYLGQYGIDTVLVEGGSIVNDSFLRKGFINQFIVYIAPIIIGGKQAKTAFSGSGFAALSDALRLEIKQLEMIGEDIKIIANRKDETNVHWNSGRNRPIEGNKTSF